MLVQTENRDERISIDSQTYERLEDLLRSALSATRSRQYLDLCQHQAQVSGFQPPHFLGLIEIACRVHRFLATVQTQNDHSTDEYVPRLLEENFVSNVASGMNCGSGPDNTDMDQLFGLEEQLLR